MGKSFFDFFPVPKFLDMPSVGLSLTDDSLSFIDFGLKQGVMTLARHDFQKMPPGAIESGVVKRADDVIKVLSDFKRKHDLRFIRATLPEEKAFLFRTAIPNIPDNEIREALQFKIEENVPISATDAVFDFYTVSDGDKNKNVVVTVLPKIVVSEYLEVFDKSGLVPLFLEIESQAIARAAIKAGDKGTFLIINVEESKTGLYIVSQNLVQFTSSLAFGKSFFDSLSQEGGDDKSPLGNSGETKVYTLKSDKEAILREEIDKIMAYWETLDHESEGLRREIQKIVACGEEVTSNNFQEYFHSNLSRAVEPANVWVNAFSFDDYIPSLTFEESLKYAAPVGLALTGISRKSRI